MTFADYMLDEPSVDPPGIIADHWPLVDSSMSKAAHHDCLLRDWS